MQRMGDAGAGVKCVKQIGGVMTYVLKELFSVCWGCRAIEFAGVLEV